MQVLEAQILEFVIHRVEAQTIGDRRIDFQRFTRHAFLLGLRNGVERAHVVQAIGELDEDHAYIAGHREQHFAEVFGLRLFECRELQLIEFGNTVDELGDGLAVFFGDIGFGRGCVFDHIVQEGGDQRLRVEMPFRQNGRDRERVRHVGLAGIARLALVRNARHRVRRHDIVDVGGFKISGEYFV